MTANKKQYMFIGMILILFTFMLFKFSYISVNLKNLIAILSPIVAGSVLAFAINVPMRFLETKLLNFMNKKAEKYKRPLALFIVMLVIISVVILLATRIIPELINIVNKIINKLPSLYESVNTWLKELNINLDELISSSILPQNVSPKDIQDKLMYAGKFLLHGVTSSGTIISDIFSNVLGIFFTLMFVIYLLMSKEKLVKQGKMLLYSRISEAQADKCVRIANMANQIFSSFIAGQCVEAIILGTLIFIFMSIFGMPYALLISMVVAVLALIPIMGAWISCIVGAILILTVNPTLALGFVIMFLVVQTFEGNVIYPRVMGSVIGLPALWILIAVVLGQSLLGLFGTLLFIPLTSLIYKLVGEYANKKLIEKNIDISKIN